MANPYAMAPLYHSPGVQSYCTPTDNLSLAGHYTDMRNSASWYGTTANDPRFASKLKLNLLKWIKFAKWHRKKVVMKSAKILESRKKWSEKQSEKSKEFSLWMKGEGSSCCKNDAVTSEIAIDKKMLKKVFQLEVEWMNERM